MIVISLESYQALQKSIKHWEENLQNSPDITVGAHHCALCSIHNESFITKTTIKVTSCNYGPSICPIEQVSSQPFCKETPYYLVLRSLEECEYTAIYDNEILLKMCKVTLYKAVQEELNFLNNVLAQCVVKE